jgi:hypothetical protein
MLPQRVVTLRMRVDRVLSGRHAPDSAAPLRAAPKSIAGKSARLNVSTVVFAVVPARDRHVTD